MHHFKRKLYGSIAKCKHKYEAAINGTEKKMKRSY
jgi:hypothetical protein